MSASIVFSVCVSSGVRLPNQGSSLTNQVMTAEYLQRSQVVVNTNRNVNDSREWSPSNTGSKLLFNEAIPGCTRNCATYVDPPTAIVREELLPLPEEHTFEGNMKTFIRFTALSEEKLNAAVELAKGDLRLRRLNSLNKSPLKQKASFLEKSDVEPKQELEATPSKVRLKASGTKDRETKPKGRLIQHTLHKYPTTHKPLAFQSPPTNEQGLQVNNHLGHEIHRMQHELEICIQKAKELASREQKVVEPPDPEDQAKLDLRKLKQAARSTSILYTLQLQVKELQKHLEKGHDQKTKSTSLQRLAAAHRGALQVLYVFIQQLSDTTCYTNLPNFKDLAQFIRQLCLCTTKVELNEGSAVPQSALNILQKLETLDSTLSILNKLRKKKACPPLRKSHHSTSITASRGAFIHQNRPVKAAKQVKAKEKAQRKPKAVSYVLTHRKYVLQAYVKKLAQQWEQENKAYGCFRKTTRNKHNQAHKTDFLQPTVSAQLRVNQMPQKEQSVPANVRSMFKAEPSLNLEKKQPAQEEAMRSKMISPTRWAEGEQKAPENVQPVDQPQSAESGEPLSEALLEDLLEDTARGAWAVLTDRQLELTAQRRMQMSTLENMLVRMEEIQRDQEQVKRRVTATIYTEPLTCDKPLDTGKGLGSRPSSPQPIRLTQPVLNPAAEIILVKPLDTGVLLDTRSIEEVRSSTMFPVTVQRGRGAVLSVPCHMLRSIRQNRENYDAYLSALSLKSTRGISLWAIADSLVEELLVETLTNVAAEFQDVVEEYAEAVFTSEFIQPV